MTEGDGRESDTQHNNDYLYSDAPAPGSPNASNVRAYTRQYQYDKIGNVQQVKQLGTNGFTRNFVYNTGVNTLQKIEDGSNVNIQSFTYDDVGNQITAGTTRNYVWNAANELITYYNQAGSSDPTIFAQYNYSGGNRVSKMVRTGSAGSPIYERVIYIDGIFEYHILENGTTYEKNYVHIMDDKSRIAMVRIGDQFPDDITNAVTYNLEDQIGSSTVRLNTTGGVIDKEEYYPFGDSSLRTFSKKRYRYVGKEKDLESGLYYYGARYYAAWTCRFISIDPLAADYPFYTPYNYAGNKPINKIDIDGMQEEKATKAPTNNTSGSNVENNIDPEFQNMHDNTIIKTDATYNSNTSEGSLTIDNISDPYLGKEFNLTPKESAPQYSSVNDYELRGNKAINFHSSIKDISNKATYIGIATSSTEYTMFAKTNPFSPGYTGSGWWLDKTGHFRSLNTTGNGTIGGKISFGLNRVKNLSKFNTVLGTAGAGFSFGNAIYEYKLGNTQEAVKSLGDGVAGVVMTFGGPYGLVIGATYHLLMYFMSLESGEDNSSVIDYSKYVPADATGGDWKTRASMNIRISPPPKHKVFNPVY